MSKGRGDRLLFALVVVSFLLSTAVSLISLHVVSQHNEREMNKVLATQVYDRIISSLSEPITVSRTMSNDSFLHDLLLKEQQPGQDGVEQSLATYLSGLERGLDCEAAFAISNRSLGYYTGNGLMRTVRPEREYDEWYRQLLISPEPYALDVDNDEANANDLTVYVNAKVMGTDNTVLGVCGVGVRMTGIQDLFRMLEEDFNVKISLVNTHGIVQVDTNKESIEHTSLASLIGAHKSSQYEYQDLEGGRFAITKYVDILDWYLIVQSTDADEAGGFLSVILLNALLCAGVLIILVIALRRNRKHTEALSAASLTDGLTMLHNRRAFEEDKDAMLQQPPKGDLVCVAIDVNGLKTVNDTLGHEAGDQLIQGAADCLKQSLSRFGTVYRTGGDEFAALLHMSEQEQATAEQDLTQAVDAWSGPTVKVLSMSCGFVAQREFPQENVHDLCRIADKRMYEEKTRYYERNGITRRKT